MKLARIGVLAVVAFALTACSTQTKYERLAHRITQAVMANDVADVAALFSRHAHITRMVVAQYAAELNGLGKLRSVTETYPCDTRQGWHCFNVVFDTRIYREHMRVNPDGKITDWYYHIATTPLPTPEPT